MPKQTTRFYRQNEAKVMESLGLTPTKNSGSGWIEKADGQNDYILCELKSTENASIGVKFADIAKLEEQAIVSNKLPLFAINDLTNGEVFVIMRPEHIQDVAKYLRTGKHDKPAAVANQDIVQYVHEKYPTRPRKKIGAPSESERNANKYQKKEVKAYE